MRCKLRDSYMEIQGRSFSCMDTAAARLRKEAAFVAGTGSEHPAQIRTSGFDMECRVNYRSACLAFACTKHVCPLLLPYMKLRRTGLRNWVVVKEFKLSYHNPETILLL